MTTHTIQVPDLGSISNASVIECMLQVGDTVEVDTPLLTLESDKASMDVPSPVQGTITAWHVQVGDQIASGDTIAIVELASASTTPSRAKVDPPPAAKPQADPPPPAPAEPPVPDTSHTAAPSPNNTPPTPPSTHGPYAGPAVRKLAREWGVPLDRVTGTGPRGRTLPHDVQRTVRDTFASGNGLGPGLPAMPDVDHAAFGPLRSEPLTRIKQLTGRHMRDAWLSVPRVTHMDEADVTELDGYRKASAQRRQVKMSLLPFVIKAYAHTLLRHPRFNASLDPSLTELVIKDYVHMGVAVDTPKGLVVPVLRDVPSQGVVELATTLSEVSHKARQQQLKPQDFQGASSTVSSLGGIGGHWFTPIVPLPSVAILGLCRTITRPVWQNDTWLPRLHLPLVLSYDHRVIDGAEAARFMVDLCRSLTDMRELLM